MTPTMTHRPKMTRGIGSFQARRLSVISFPDASRRRSTQNEAFYLAPDSDGKFRQNRKWIMSRLPSGHTKAFWVEARTISRHGVWPHIQSGTWESKQSQRLVYRTASTLLSQFLRGWSFEENSTIQQVRRRSKSSSIHFRTTLLAREPMLDRSI